MNVNYTLDNVINGVSKITKSHSYYGARYNMTPSQPHYFSSSHKLPSYYNVASSNNYERERARHFRNASMNDYEHDHPPNMRTPMSSKSQTRIPSKFLE